MNEIQQATSATSRRQAFVALTVSSLVAIVLAEFVVRIVLPHPAFYQGHPGNVPGLVTPHEERGYTWTPGFVGTMTSHDFSNEYAISAQGFRDRDIAEDERRRILVVGDSFAGGEGVDVEETFSKQLESLFDSERDPGERIRVVNAGVTGYGARQMRQMAQEFVPLLDPERVIIGVFPHGFDRVNNPFVLFGEHLVRQKEVPKMRPKDDGYIWYQSGFRNGVAARLDVWSQKYLHFAAYIFRIAGQFGSGEATAENSPQRSLPPAAERLQPVFGELHRLAEFLDASNVEFTVLVISGQSLNGEFSADSKAMAQAVREFCADNGIDVVDPMAAQEAFAQGTAVLRFDNDGHWTAPAHKIAASQLKEHLDRVDLARP